MTTTSIPRRWAILSSALVGLIGLQWWLTPETYPFGPGDDAAELSFLGELGAGSAAALAGALGATGMATAWALGRRWGRRPALVGAGIQVVVLGYVVPDVTALMLVAYFLALVGPVTVLGFAVHGCLRRWPDGATAALTGIALAAALSGIVTPSALVDLARRLGGGFETLGARPLYVLGALAAGAMWATVLVDAVRDRRRRCDDCGRTGWGRWTRPDRVASWGRRVTWAAALCPLPYALLRLTWLTPWPVGISHDELVENPGIRLFGLLLGVVAIGGAALTLGLTYRWGEVFPRWVPGLRGRPVPTGAAVWPAIIVAVAVTVGGHSVVQAAIVQADGWRDTVGLTLVLPFPVWGPLLATAALGYALRRRTECDGCRPSRTLAVLGSEGEVTRVQGLGTPDSRGRAPRRAAHRSPARARLRTRGRGVPGV